MDNLKKTEGFITFRDYKVWYCVVEPQEPTNSLPLLCLHGGPGVPHDYIEPLAEMANHGHKVVLYDQLGCGNSDHAKDDSLWTMDLFVQEIDVIRKALSLDQVHIFGHSWGAMLAMQYALGKPSGLSSLVLASGTADMHQWVLEANRLRRELPDNAHEIMLKHEENNTTDDPTYHDAMMVFYGTHVCRLEQWPDCANRSFGKFMENPTVYNIMWGPSEFYVTGSLKDWNIVDRLGEIKLPTLITSGRYDEATPEISEVINKGIKGSEWIVFENSSHLSHLEEQDLYINKLRDFLNHVES